MALVTKCYLVIAVLFVIYTIHQISYVTRSFTEFLVARHIHPCMWVLVTTA